MYVIFNLKLYFKIKQKESYSKKANYVYELKKVILCKIVKI